MGRYRGMRGSAARNAFCDAGCVRMSHCGTIGAFGLLLAFAGIISASGDGTEALQQQVAPELVRASATHAPYVDSNFATSLRSPLQLDESVDADKHGGKAGVTVSAPKAVTTPGIHGPRSQPYRLGLGLSKGKRGGG